MTGTGIHVLDVLTRIAGPVRRVHAQFLSKKPGPDPWDSLAVLLEFASGVGRHARLRALDPGFSAAARLRAQRFGRGGQPHRNHRSARAVGTAPVRHKPEVADSVRTNLEAFADAVAGAAPYPIPPAIS